MAVLEEYIRSEQQLKRIDSHADAKLAAFLMVLSSFFRDFVENFFGK